jgi:hypothetical protein
MTEKSGNPRGQPVIDKIEWIPTPPEDNAEAVFDR